MKEQVNSRETPKFRIQNNPSIQQRNAPLQVVEGVSQRTGGKRSDTLLRDMYFYMALRKLNQKKKKKTKALEFRKERQTTKKITFGSL